MKKKLKKILDQPIEWIKGTKRFDEGDNYYLTEPFQDKLLEQICQLFPQPLTNEDLRVKLHNIIFLQKSEDATELLDRIMEALPQPLDDKDWREEIADFIEKMPFSQKPTRNWCEFTAAQILALLPGIEEARKRGIREAIDNLKKHHCIVDVEARIKEIENE